MAQKEGVAGPAHAAFAAKRGARTRGAGRGEGTMSSTAPPTQGERSAGGDAPA